MSYLNFFKPTCPSTADPSTYDDATIEQRPSLLGPQKAKPSSGVSPSNTSATANCIESNCKDESRQPSPGAQPVTTPNCPNPTADAASCDSNSESMLCQPLPDTQAAEVQLGVPRARTPVSASLSSELNIAARLRQLFEETIKIDHLFQDVHEQLGEATSDDVSKAAFKADWSKIHEMFHDLVWQARTTATKIRVRIADYTDVIVPLLQNDSDSDEEKLLEIKGFLAIAPPIPSDALEQIGRLSADIAEFVEKLPPSYLRRDGRGRFAIIIQAINRLGAATPVRLSPAQDPPTAGAAPLADAHMNLLEFSSDVKAVSEQVVACFWELWSRLSDDGKRLQAQVERRAGVCANGSEHAQDNPSFNENYAEIKLALHHYSTNISGPRVRKHSPFVSMK